ncbi:MAG: hypothetical protein EPN86_03220 [Nanoarchaeota archaeon]|nr:MAG: hypothetical protein EPN86_03220 [Nanoarchaeota archaeon]
MKNIKVIFSADAQEVYNYLEKQESKKEKMILKALDKKVEIIKTNMHYGEPIAKNLIPNEYKVKYGITNLFWVELPQFWRMLYTLKNDEIEIIAFILDVIDHPTYDKKFGYKGK